MLYIKFNKLSLIVFIQLLFLVACSNENTDNRVPLISCGGGIQFSCPTNFYCDLGNDCGGIDKKGVCAPIPQSCDLTEEITCGCDGKEYKNECIAKTLGVTKKNDGPCITSPKFTD